MRGARQILPGLLGLLGLLGLAGCDREPAAAPQTPMTSTTPLVVPETEQVALLEAFQEEATPVLRKLVVAAPGFREAVHALLMDTDEEALEIARNAWTLLYESYNRAWPVLATRGELDPTLVPHLARADTWPILPGYIDAMPEWPDSGIVYDVTVDVDINTLLSLHGMTDPSEVAVGFQVLELLLFGLPDAPREVAGLAPVVVTESEAEKPLNEYPEMRRRAYLDAASALLLEDLSALIHPQPLPDAARLPEALSRGLRSSRERLAALQAQGPAEAGEGTDGGEYLSARSHDVALAALTEALAAWQDADQPAGAALSSWRATVAGTPATGEGQATP